MLSFVRVVGEKITCIPPNLPPNLDLASDADGVTQEPLSPV